MILDAAIELIDEQGGPEHLTMRAVGQRLDVTAPAIYHYFEGRDELVEAIVARVCATIVADAPDEGDWVTRLQGLTISLVDHAADLPSSSLWAITEFAHRPPMLRLHEAILDILLGAGLTVEAAVRIKGAVLRLCVGHLALQSVEPGHEWHQLPGEQFPRYRRAGPTMDTIDRRGLFIDALDALLAGLASAY